MSVGDKVPYDSQFMALCGKRCWGLSRDVLVDFEQLHTSTDITRDTKVTVLVSELLPARIICITVGEYMEQLCTNSTFAE